jgi:hypothetical protein
MTAISSVNATALAILQRPVSPLGPAEDARTTAVRLVAAANGVAPEQISGADLEASRRRSEVEAMFSVNAPNLNQMKLDLYKRVGEALGIDQSKYDSMPAYWLALKITVAKVLEQENGAAILRGIERDLGLNKLGVSLETVIDAIVDPDANKELTEALEDQINDGAPDRAIDASDETAATLAAQVDEEGAYSV